MTVMKKSPAGVSDGADRAGAGHFVLFADLWMLISVDADRLDAGYEALPGSHVALYRDLARTVSPLRRRTVCWSRGATGY